MSMMCRPKWPFLLMCVFHDVRNVEFRELTGSQQTPGFWGVTDGVIPLSAAWTHEEGLPPKTGIPGFWDSTVPVSSRIGEDIVRSSTARYRLEEPV